jgi:nonsense-mediated mRNA decay protein 3
MSFKKFCPRCGKETEELVGKICINCFKEKNKLFSVGKVKINLCKYCGKILHNDLNEDFSEEALGEEVASQVKLVNELKQPKIFVEIQKLSDVDYEALIKVQGFLGNTIVEEEKTIKFQTKETTCDACMKLNSDYREGIIQLRSKDDDTALEMFEITQGLLQKERAKNSLSGISKITEVKNGYDLWVGSKKASAKISREVSKIFDAELKVSKKLIGQEQSGKRKYRFTFLVKKS